MEHILPQGYGIVATEGDGEACRWWQRYYGQKQPAALPFGVGEGTSDLARLLPSPQMNVVGEQESSGVSEADAALWRVVLEELSLQMTQATFAAWLADARVLAREENRFIVGLRNEEVRDWVSHRLREPILRTLRQAAGMDDVLIRFVVESG